MSAARAYLHPARHRRNLAVVTRALATRILFEESGNSRYRRLRPLSLAIVEGVLTQNGDFVASSSPPSKADSAPRHQVAGERRQAFRKITSTLNLAGGLPAGVVHWHDALDVAGEALRRQAECAEYPAYLRRHALQRHALLLAQRPVQQIRE